MTEIKLILASSTVGSPTTAIALADSGIGVGTIPQSAIAALLVGREQIIKMMTGAPRMKASELIQFGRAMGKALFCDDVGPTWSEASLHPPVITKILATTPELKAIPWEFAAWPSGTDGPQLLNSVVRLVPQARASPPTPLQRDAGFRVLLLSASPLNFDRIPWQDIRDGLIQTFQAAIPEFEIVADAHPAKTSTYIRIVSAATQSAVRKWIRKDDPHVVHFVGHGTDKGIALVDGKSNRGLLMDGTALGAALQAAPSCRLLILSACDTANPLTIDPVNESIGTLAEQTVRNALPAVVASQLVIDRRTIATFCEGLYPELIKSGSIDLAVAAGRCNVAAELGSPDSAAIEWGIPVLYRRLGASRLFASSEAEQ